MEELEALFARLHRSEGMPDALRLRLHRAISWCVRAEAEADDPDARFLFFWIAFNAAYAQPMEEKKEIPRLHRFVRKLIQLDAKGQRLLRQGMQQDAFYEAFFGLMENPYVYRGFWNDASGGWRASFDRARRDASWWLRKEGMEEEVLKQALQRLYVLRNQIVHGGATWQSSLNREQVQDGAQMMALLVPRIVAVMIEHPEEDWGKPEYPPVGTDGRPMGSRWDWRASWQRWMQALARRRR